MVSTCNFSAALLNVCWDWGSTQTSTETQIQMHTYIGWCCAVIAVRAWHISKASERPCGWWIIFQPIPHFLQQRNRCDNCFPGERSNKIHCFVFPAQTFTAVIRFALLHNRYSYTFGKKEFIAGYLFNQVPVLFERDSQQSASPNDIILSSIYPNRHFLLSTFTLFVHLQIGVHSEWREGAPCLDRLWVLKFIHDLKWNFYIGSIINDAGKNCPFSVPFHVLSSTFTRAWLGRK